MSHAQLWNTSSWVALEENKAMLLLTYHYYGQLLSQLTRLDLGLKTTSNEKVEVWLGSGLTSSPKSSKPILEFLFFAAGLLTTTDLCSPSTSTHCGTAAPANWLTSTRSRSVSTYRGWSWSYLSGDERPDPHSHLEVISRLARGTHTDTIIR